MPSVARLKRLARLEARQPRGTSYFDVAPLALPIFEAMWPQGDRGPQGLQGTQGPQGLPGRDAIAGFTLVAAVIVREDTSFTQIGGSSRVEIKHIGGTNGGDWIGTLNDEPSKHFVLAGPRAHGGEAASAEVMPSDSPRTFRIHTSKGLGPSDIGFWIIIIDIRQ